MPQVEVDENELLQLRQLSGVASRMIQNPQAKRLLEQAHKMVDPNAVTPLLDQEAAIMSPIEEIRKEFADFKAETAKEKAEREKAEKLGAIDRQIEEGVSQLQRDGWQEDGIKMVRDLMDERGITDPLIAAAYIEKKHPPQQLATPSSTGAWNFLEGVNDGEDDLKKLIETKGENNMLLDKMAFEALNDVRGGSRR